MGDSFGASHGLHSSRVGTTVRRRHGISGFILPTKGAEGRASGPEASVASRARRFLGGACEAGDPSWRRRFSRITASPLTTIRPRNFIQMAVLLDQYGRGCREVGTTGSGVISRYTEFMFLQLEEMPRVIDAIDGLCLDIFNLSRPGRDCCCQLAHIEIRRGARPLYRG